MNIVNGYPLITGTSIFFLNPHVGTIMSIIVSVPVDTRTR